MQILQNLLLVMIFGFGCFLNPASAAPDAAIAGDTAAIKEAAGATAEEKAEEAKKNEEARAKSAEAARAKHAEDMKKQMETMREMNAASSSFSLSENLSVGNEAFLELNGASSTGDGVNDRNIISRVIFLIASIVGTLAILLLVIGAYYLIVSQGDENTFNKGKTIVEYTFIGLVIVFMAYMIVQFVLSMISF